MCSVFSKMLCGGSSQTPSVCCHPQALILGDLGLQELGAGLGIPAGDWAGLWWREHLILPTRLVISDKSPGPLALQKRIPTKMARSKIKYTFRGKEYRMCRKHMGGLRGRVPKLHPCGSLSYSYGYFFQVCFGQSFDLPGLRSVTGKYLRILPRVHTDLLAKTDFTKKASGSSIP